MSTPFARIVGALLLAALAACHDDYPPAQVPPVQSEAAAPQLYAPQVEPDYVIGPGDGLLIQSYYDSNLKQSLLVRPDGYVSALLVGEIQAAGRTPKDLGKELTRLYGRVLDHPDVTVSISSSAGMAVYVGGEVKSPTQLPLKGDLTLLQSITEAGGFRDGANKEQVLIIRRTPDGRYHTLQQNVEAVLTNQAGELYLHRYDIVYVPKSHIAKVDQFVDQFINSVIPRSVTGIFGYQVLQTSAPTITPGAQ
jgi:protein involved in polysaccharide export with SLBB domain